MNACRTWIVCLSAVTIATVAVGPAVAATPRSDRLALRFAERAYARQSIAEARAARAEARVAEIAPLVPVPPPPRPATVRRMARAGVPLGAPPAVRLSARPPLPSPSGQAVAASVMPRSPQPSAATASAPQPAPMPQHDDVAPDGTRSVLAAAAEEPAAPASREAAGPAVTHPPIELLPTP